MDTAHHTASISRTAEMGRAIEIPRVSFARQGDVIVIPEQVLPVRSHPHTPVPPAGVALVRSPYGGHTHQLMASGDVLFDATEQFGELDDRGGFDDDEDLNVGVLKVEEGALAYLIHPEHAAIGLLPGRYTVRRQRERGELTQFVYD